MQERVRKAVVIGLAVLSFIAPIKFTQPVILHRMFQPPSEFFEWIFAPWLPALFYAAAGALFLMGLGCGGWRAVHWTVWLFAGLFLAAQTVAALGSCAPDLTFVTMELFLGLVAGYLLGASQIRDSRDLIRVLTGWMIAGFVIAWSGIYQANGGLEETRRFLHQHPEYATAPEIWTKIQSDRIFSTFGYPNALGGFVAAAVFVIGAWGVHSLRAGGAKPASLAAAPASERPPDLNLMADVRGGAFRKIRGGICAALVILGLLYCLWKSQSKGAYAALFLAFAPGAWLLVRRRTTALIVVGIAFAIALLGFGLGYGRAALEKGAKTWEARMGYWRAAWKIGRDHPIRGAGPGSFGRMYPGYKTAEDEETRLVHNNYLQMWADSGLAGFVTFLLWLPGTLVLWVWRWRAMRAREGMVPILVWCACTAFALHSLVDFDLYMIGNSWPIFVLLGYLSNTRPPAPIPG